MFSVPFVSIIIPVKNEEKRIKECLKRVVRQTYPPDKIEILVVDGMSTDRTREIVREIAQNSPIPIKILDNPMGQRTTGLNIGIKNAKGEIIMRVDAGSRIPEDYVEKCVTTLLETGADNVGGKQIPIYEKGNKFQKALVAALNVPFSVGNPKFRFGKKGEFVDTVYLGCWRKDVFKKVGLFDEEAPVLAEEYELNTRIKKAGGKIFLNPDIKVYYAPLSRDSYFKLIKAYIRYGGARANYLLKHKWMPLRYWIPPLFLLYILLLPIFLLLPLENYLKMIIAMPILMYLFLLFTVSLYLTIKYKDIGIFYRLLIIFPIMHFSWAYGFWKRILIPYKPRQYWGG